MCDVVANPLVVINLNVTELEYIILNDVTYTPPAPIVLTADTVNTEVEAWLNTLGFGSIWDYFTRDNIPPAPGIARFSISTNCTCFVFDSSKVNRVGYGGIFVDMEFSHCGAVDTETKEGSLACIAAKIKTSFCVPCSCADICNNPEALNVMKATLLMTELDILDAEEVDYEDKLNLYKTVLSKLCLC